MNRLSHPHVSRIRLEACEACRHNALHNDESKQPKQTHAFARKLKVDLSVYDQNDYQTLLHAPGNARSYSYKPRFGARSAFSKLQAKLAGTKTLVHVPQPQQAALSCTATVFEQQRKAEHASRPPPREEPLLRYGGSDRYKPVTREQLTQKLSLSYKRLQARAEHESAKQRHAELKR